MEYDIPFGIKSARREIPNLASHVPTVVLVLENQDPLEPLREGSAGFDPSGSPLPVTVQRREHHRAITRSARLFVVPQ